MSDKLQFVDRPPKFYSTESRDKLKFVGLSYSTQNRDKLKFVGLS